MDHRPANQLRCDHVGQWFETSNIVIENAVQGIDSQLRVADSEDREVDAGVRLPRVDAEDGDHVLFGSGWG